MVVAVLLTPTEPKPNLETSPAVVADNNAHAFMKGASRWWRTCRSTSDRESYCHDSLLSTFNNNY